MKPKYSALFTSVNLLLGVGPLILPMPFFKAGIALSTLWMIVVSILSYNSAIFISESIEKVRELTNKKDYPEPSITFTDSLLTNNIDQDEKELIEQEETKIDHTDQFRILFGPKWALIPSLSISIYLIGTSVSKCIMTGKIMAQVFEKWNYETNQSTSILEEFNFWILIFFLCGSAFSFRSVDKTKVMQMLIIGVRVISIVLLLGGALYLILRNGEKRVVPEGKGIFNFSNFVEIFSNSVFSLMFHHSLPNIIRPLKSVEEQKFVLRYAFLISGAVLIIIPLTAVLAFGEELVDIENPHNLIFYNFDFKGRIDFIYWFTSFYVFLNVAAFSVYIIVIRANLLQVLAPKIDSNKLCSNSYPILEETIISSICILSSILVISWQLQNQIQIVLDFTGGILGILILLIIPTLEVYQTRKLSPKDANRKHRFILPLFMLSLGFLFLVFNFVQIVGSMKS